jgi:hypothetical protein
MIGQISHYITASAPPQAGPYSGNAHGNVGPYAGNAHGDCRYPTLRKKKNSFIKLSTWLKHL